MNGDIMKRRVREKRIEGEMKTSEIYY